MAFQSLLNTKHSVLTAMSEIDDEVVALLKPEWWFQRPPFAMKVVAANALVSQGLDFEDGALQVLCLRIW